MQKKRIPLATRSKWFYFATGLLSSTALFLGLGFFSSDFSLLKTVEFYIQNDYITRNLDTQKLERGAIDGYLRALQDPHTRYLDPGTRELLDMQVQGTILGIGIVCKRVSNGLQITEIIADGAAEKAGLRVQDIVTSIENIDMSSKYQFGILQQVLERDSIRLTLLREGNKFPIVIARHSDSKNAISSVQTIEGIGYIHIRSFEPLSLQKEMEDAMTRIGTASALVLDLRGNTGGLLKNAIRIASFFIKEGIVVITVDRYGTQTPIMTENKKITFTKPIVVLVDKNTASASEILAAALRDHRRAITMGEPTYGKAAVQKMAVLPDGSALLYTAARYLTPLGQDLYQRGVPIDRSIDTSTNTAIETAIQLAKTLPQRR